MDELVVLNRNITINKIKCLIRLCLQGRCVTVDDYKTYTKKLFPNTQEFLYGVERMVVLIQAQEYHLNPEYGKVFISIKSTTGENLTSEQKSNLV